MKRYKARETARLFVDTWGWLALADAKDPAHQDTGRIRRAHTGQSSRVTSDYILLDESRNSGFTMYSTPIPILPRSTWASAFLP